MKLGDVCTKIGSGATPKGGKEAYKPSGIPLIRSQNVLDWSFTSNGLAFIDESQAAALANVEVEPRDILLNITGDSVARACMVPDWYTPARVNQHVSIVRPGCDFDPTFLLCFLQSSKPLLLKLASSGATRNALTKGMIEDLEIELPDIETQRAIASLIGQIQQIIVLNRQANDYLLELATTLFEHALDKSRTEVSLGDIVDLEDSKRIPLNSRDRAQHKGPYPYYGATAIMDYVDDYLFDGIRILLGEDGTVISDGGKPILQYVWGKYWVNNHAHILKASSIYPLEEIYIALSRTTIKHIVTGAVQMKISQRNLKNLRLTMPGPDAISNLSDLFEMYRQNVEENKTLEALRGSILPKLMSGEIDVSQVETPMQLNNHLGDC